MLDRDSELGYPFLADESERFVPQGDHRRVESLMEWQVRLTRNRQLRSGEVAVSGIVEPLPRDAGVTEGEQEVDEAVFLDALLRTNRTETRGDRES